MYRTLGSLTVLKLVGAFLGIFYSILQVKYFGTDRVIETFFAAQSLVYLVTSLTQSGQLAEVFLPVYLELKEKYGLTVASLSFSSIINRIICFVSIILVLMFLIAPFLMKLFIPGFEFSDQLFASNIFRAFLPLVLLQILSSFINTVLNAERIYGRVEIAGIISYVVSIVLLVLFYEAWSIWTLVFALYAGKLIDLSIGVYYLKRQQIRYSLNWNVDKFDSRELFRTLFSTFRYTGSTQVLNWAYTASLSFLPQGIFAIFKYVNILFSKSGSIIIDPIKTLLFTEFSANRESNQDKINILLQRSISIAVLVGILVFSIALFAGYEGMSFIWGGEKFDIDKLNKAYPILITFFSLYIFQIAYGISRKYTVSIGRAKELYNWQALTQFISAFVVYILIYYFAYWGLIVALLINRVLLLSVPFLMNTSVYKEVFNLKFNSKCLFLLGFMLLSFWVVHGIYLEEINAIIGKGSDLFYVIVLSGLAVFLFLSLVKILSFDELKAFQNILKSKFSD